MSTISHDGSAAGDGTILRRAGRKYPLPVVLMPDGSGDAATESTNAEGSKDVAVAGTPVRLAAVDTFVDSLEVKAKSTNGGLIKVGFSNNVPLWELTPTEWKGWKATPGKKINLKNIWIDAAVNGEGVIWQSMN